MKAVIIISGLCAAVQSFLLLAAFAVGLNVLDIGPMLGTPLGRVRGYQISCATTAGGTTLGDGQTFSSVYVWINSATPVYIGGTDVDSTHGTPFCTNTALCPTAALSLDAKEARCLSSSGTVTATVLAGSI